MTTLAEYTCCKCGKQFEEDSEEAAAELELYGEIYCVDCAMATIEDMMGQSVGEICKAMEEER